MNVLPSREPLLKLTAAGLHCEAGNFYVDPWCPVERAIITHAHSDHARPGSQRYLASTESRFVLRTRLGTDADIQFIEYGRSFSQNGVSISLHPAGHILGSAQIRIEYRGEVWVVSGDYKVEPDPTCTPFELIRCHTFVTESTFGLPVYRWPDQQSVFDQINAWWRRNQETGKSSVLYAYTLGKSQRVLAGVDAGIGPIFTHGAIQRMNRDYRDTGITLPETQSATFAPSTTDWSRALVLAPPMAGGTPWLRRFGNVSSGFASGWMRIRGTRRRRAIDRGFVLSDHVDWPGLTSVIQETGAESVWVTHGYSDAVARWLRENGLKATAIPTRFEGEQDEGVDDTSEIEEAAERA